MGCLLYKMCYYTTPFGESLLAIQDGRFTLPDAKHHFYSKQLNGLIGYMLEPDPVKRPDVFHVAAGAFALASLTSSPRRPSASSVLATTRNMPSGEFVLSQLPTPLTESEWRARQQPTSSAASKRNKEDSASSVAAAAAAMTTAAAATSTNTTVNPRERPKAHLTNVNSLNQIPLSNPGLISQQQQQQQQQQGQSAQRNTANKIAGIENQIYRSRMIKFTHSCGIK